MKGKTGSEFLSRTTFPFLFLDSRLIVIAEKDVVYNRFPIPLINRLEKHFLVMSSGLTDAQKQVTKKLQAWVENFAEIFQQPHKEKRFVGL